MQKLDIASYGPWVKLSAPGDQIYSAFPISQYSYWSGTSMAAPFVAGQAALLGSRHPTLTAQSIRECLLGTAQPLSPELGAGLADFEASFGGTHPSCAAPLSDDGGDDSDDDGNDDDLDEGDEGADDAGDVTCTSALGVGPVDNVLVPQGKTCSLDGTIVLISIKVEAGATLRATGVTIHGNIQADGAEAVSLSHITPTTDAPTDPPTTTSAVYGSIQVKNGGGVTIEGVHVYGNAQLERNVGAITISSNTIDGNLQCKENQWKPTGGNNKVKGSAEDQCADLISSCCRHDGRTNERGRRHWRRQAHLPAGACSLRR
jgi:hypothetical protein